MFYKIESQYNILNRNYFFFEYLILRIIIDGISPTNTQGNKPGSNQLLNSRANTMTEEVFNETDILTDVHLKEQLASNTTGEISF